MRRIGSAFCLLAIVWGGLARYDPIAVRSPPDNFTAYSVGVSWEITSLIAREHRHRAAAAQAASVDLEIAWKEWQVAQEARTAAYQVLALNASLVAARHAEQRLAENLDIL